jgi:hypothetical protein
VFQKELLCSWEGYVEFGGNATQPQKCRRVFATVQEYQNHLRRDHSWFCAACDEKNTGLSFPACSLCGNTRSGEGIDGIAALQQSFNRVKHRLQMFLYTDGAERDPDDYVIQSRLIELVSQRRQSIAETEAAHKEQLQREHEEYVKRMSKTQSLVGSDDPNKNSLDATEKSRLRETKSHEKGEFEFMSIKMKSNKADMSEFTSQKYNENHKESLKAKTVRVQPNVDKLPLLSVSKPLSPQHQQGGRAGGGGSMNSSPTGRSTARSPLGGTARSQLTTTSAGEEMSLTARLEVTKRERRRRKSKVG